MTSTPLEVLVGKTGEFPECKVFDQNVAMHWYLPYAKAGDRCLCGATVMQPEAGDESDA